MRRHIELILALVFLAGCQSAPVQEMSDARQAIEAARIAGAEQRAPADLEAAQADMVSAERHLQAQEYARARDAALAAKHRAALAMALSRSSPPQ
ncbi:MAG TPA: DUF4398 domain-containing protein [Steroidobacteraceae bacterium]|nr:DUF4398 domain-containing protein [Steroidobacteraceae bacterium]